MTTIKKLTINIAALTLAAGLAVSTSYAEDAGESYAFASAASFSTLSSSASTTPYYAAGSIAAAALAANISAYVEVKQLSFEDKLIAKTNSDLQGRFQALNVELSPID
jgi:hypothetical protein